MKLSEYLADYLARGIDELHEAGIPMDFSKKGLKPIIQQGIETFAPTQHAIIRVTNERNRQWEQYGETK